MSVAVIGHDRTRKDLARHRNSFALLGPPGVGKSLMVSEWVGDRISEPIDFSQLHQSFHPDVVYTVDAQTSRVPWERLLRLLEEDRMTTAVVATGLPGPVQSRLPIFRVGLLSDFEVGRILQSQRRVLPGRQLVARILGGSMAKLELAVAAAETFETWDAVLSVGRYDGTQRFADYRAALCALHTICSAVLSGADDLPIRRAALDRVPRQLAYSMLSVDPMTETEARNHVIRFLRQACLRG